MLLAVNSHVLRIPKLPREYAARYLTTTVLSGEMGLSVSFDFLHIYFLP